MSVYVMEVYQGATLFREINVRDEGGSPVDMSTATISVDVSEDLDAADFTAVIGSENHTIELRADGNKTRDWPVGEHIVQIWLDWGAAADVEDEVIFQGIISVKGAI